MSADDVTRESHDKGWCPAHSEGLHCCADPEGWAGRELERLKGALVAIDKESEGITMDGLFEFMNRARFISREALHYELPESEEER